MFARQRRLAAMVALAMFGAAACGGAGTTTAPTSAATAGGGATAAPASAAPIAGGLLDKVLKAGKLEVSTDPNYKPQSFTEPDPSDPSKVIYKGFDIDVANEIGKRLG